MVLVPAFVPRTQARVQVGQVGPAKLSIANKAFADEVLCKAPVEESTPAVEPKEAWGAALEWASMREVAVL